MMQMRATTVKKTLHELLPWQDSGLLCSHANTTLMNVDSHGHWEAPFDLSN